MFKNYGISKLLSYSNKFNSSLSKRFFCATPYNYTAVKSSIVDNNVGMIQLYRPTKKNALNSELIKDLNHALNSFEKDSNIGCIVLCGDTEFFAAGADIKEMKDKTFSFVYETSMLEDWNYITKIR
jgi:enoyl-CoA hydratase